MNEDDDTVLTPAGPRSKSQVHSVGPGNIVRRTGEGTYVLVADSPSEHGAGVTSMGEDLVLTPGGLRPKSFVHRIKPGTTLDGTEGRYRQLDRSRKAITDFGLIRPLQPSGPDGLRTRVGPTTPARPSPVSQRAGWFRPRHRRSRDKRSSCSTASRTQR